MANRNEFIRAVADFFLLDPDWGPAYKKLISVNKLDGIRHKIDNSNTILDIFNRDYHGLVQAVFDRCKLTEGAIADQPCIKGNDFFDGFVKMVYLYVASIAVLNSIGERLDASDDAGRADSYSLDLLIKFGLEKLVGHTPAGAVKFISEIGTSNKSVSEMLKTEQYWRVGARYGISCPTQLVPNKIKYAEKWSDSLANVNSILSEAKLVTDTAWLPIYKLAKSLQ